MKKKTVFQTPWFSIETVDYDTNGPYYIMNCPDAVSIVAVTPNQDLVLVTQYRPAIDGRVLELPAGYIDEGESPETAVARELVEETGYRCRTLRYLGAHRLMPSRLSSTVHFFFGSEAVAEAVPTEAGTEVVLKTPAQITSGEHDVDMSVMAGLHICASRGLIKT